MIRRFLGILLFYIGLAGLPEDLSAFFEFTRTLLSYDSIRVLICLVAFILVVQDNLLKAIPALRKIESRIAIWWFGLRSIRVIADDKTLHPEPNRINAKDSIRETVNWSWAAIEVFSTVRAGLLNAWLYEPASGLLQRASPELIQELFRSESLRHGQIPNLLVPESKVRPAIREFEKRVELASEKAS